MSVVLHLLLVLTVRLRNLVSHHYCMLRLMHRQLLQYLPVQDVDSLSTNLLYLVNTQQPMF